MNKVELIGDLVSPVEVRRDWSTGRTIGIAVGSVATVWTAAAWWASPWHDWLVWTAMLGAVAGGIPRWWHYRWRGKVVVKRGAPRGTRRRLRQIMRRWPELAGDMDLAGSQVRHADADEIGITLTLALRPGLTAADVVARRSRVESVLETRTGGVRVLPDPNRANVAIVSVIRSDPLATPVPWPGSTATTITEPLTVGLFDNGEPVGLVLIGEHVLIGGTMGRGKSGLLNAILAALSLCPDVVAWGIDMKLGLELLPWLPVLARLATTNEEALELLTAANRVLDARARLLAGRNGRRWQPSPQEPALVIAIDELAELSARALALFERIARMGRAAGIVLVAATQRPSLSALGSLDARTQMTIRVSMGVIEARDAELILGSGRLAEGWRTERLGGPGYFLVLAPGQHETPRQARAYWLSDAAVRTAADAARPTRPALDPTSAEASGSPPERPDSVHERPDDPDRLLLVALDEAPPGGMSADDLAARLGRGRTWVYKRLMAHSSAGRAVRLRRGRWAADRAGKPRAQ